MKNIIIKYSIVFFSFLFLISGSLFAREEMSLCGVWKFALERDYKSYDSWTEGFEFGRDVTVPHTWNVEDKTERIFGKAWYEKRTIVPENWKGKHVRLCFDAVYRDVVVWVNGKQAVIR